MGKTGRRSTVNIFTCYERAAWLFFFAVTRLAFFEGEEKLHCKTALLLPLPVLMPKEHFRLLLVLLSRIFSYHFSPSLAACPKLVKNIATPAAFSSTSGRGKGSSIIEECIYSWKGGPFHRLWSHNKLPFLRRGLTCLALQKNREKGERS